MVGPRIVVLNGAPRSGKTSIARALDSVGPEPWLKFGVDAMVLHMLPERWHPGPGLRPGGERPDLEPLVAPLYRALFGSVAALARQGFRVAVDVGIHDAYTAPQHIWDLLERELGEVGYLSVRVRCSVDQLMIRRNATGYPADEEIVRRWESAIDEVDRSQISVDTSLTDSERCAKIILRALTK